MTEDEFKFAIRGYKSSPLLAGFKKQYAEGNVKMTDADLDEARANEAWEQLNRTGWPHEAAVAVVAARLAREGWTPPAPDDPLLPEAREILVKTWANADTKARVVQGDFDNNLTLLCALSGLRRGIELGKEQERNRRVDACDWRT